MTLKKSKFITSIALILLSISFLVLGGCSSSPASAPTPTQAPTQPSAQEQEKPVELNVSAAASLTDAIKAIDDLYMQKNKNVTVVVNFASSGTLQQQIEQGAPADVFISAAAKQMNALQEGELIINDMRRDLLKNKVVLVVPSNSTLNITDFMDLINDDVKKVAIGDPESVPAGTYGKQTFDLLGITEKLQPKLILGSTVRQVLAYVESGDVDAGIVFSTDAAITDNVKIVADAPEEVNSKIVYPVAVIKSSNKVEAAEAYISFLFSDEAKAIFEKYGFSVISK
jgi:molybdate transport system substrate-binding protein